MPDSKWRNRVEFIDGRAAIEAFLRRKWAKELDYRLIKELWTFAGSKPGAPLSWVDWNKEVQSLLAEAEAPPHVSTEKLPQSSAVDELERLMTVYHPGRGRQTLEVKQVGGQNAEGDAE